MNATTGLEIYTGLKIGAVVIKHVPALAKAIRKIKKQKLEGIWCVCWQSTSDNSDRYEVGSMKMEQLGKSITGGMYCAEKMWTFSGKFKEGKIAAQCKGNGSDRGSFNLRFGDGGNNEDKLEGKWSGYSETGGTVAEEYGLPFYAARKKTVNPLCHSRNFKTEKGIGACADFPETPE